MGPTRTPKVSQHGESSHARRGPSKRTRKQPQLKEPLVSVAPGVQKLKSSLRQTRRLLAKDNLAADVRVETERRLKALESDLAKAELARKERALAIRYHKIKFFERQKIVRKLNQSKQRLSSASGSSKAQLEASLSDLRVDLNYILHYPKTKKYISLYPPDIRHHDEKATVDPAGTTKTDVGREEVRQWIRQRMENGELSQEPELHLDSREDGEKKGPQRGTGESWDGRGGVPKKSGKKPIKDTEVPGVESDAFFGDDDEEDESEDQSDGHDSGMDI